LPPFFSVLFVGASPYLFGAPGGPGASSFFSTPRPGRLPWGWAFGAVWRRGGRGGRRRGLAGPVRGVGRRGRRGLPSQRRRCGWLGGGSVRWRAGHPGSSLVLSLPTPTV